MAPRLHARDLVKQLLLYGCLPRRMIGLLGLVAGFRVRRSLRPRLGPAVVAYPSPFHVHVHGHGDVAGLSVWERCRDDPGVKPKAPVQEPPLLDFAQCGVGLRE